MIVPTYHKRGSAQDSDINIGVIEVTVVLTLTHTPINIYIHRAIKLITTTISRLWFTCLMILIFLLLYFIGVVHTISCININVCIGSSLCFGQYWCWQIYQSRLIDVWIIAVCSTRYLWFLRLSPCTYFVQINTPYLQVFLFTRSDSACRRIIAKIAFSVLMQISSSFPLTTYTSVRLAQQPIVRIYLKPVDHRSTTTNR